MKADTREVLREALSAAVHRATSHDAGIRSDDRDPEHVHQARVGIRRFRTVLKEFRPLFDDGWSQMLRKEAKTLAGALGRVRDADVMLGRLRADVDSLGPGDLVIVDRLTSDREAARERLLSVLRDPGHDRLLGDLFSAAREPQFSEIDVSKRPLVDFAARAFGKLKRAVNALEAEPSVSGLHRVRILTKRARYTTEAIVPVAGEDAGRFAKRASALQDVLGEIQDATVTEQWLESLAESTPKASFAAGRLAQMQLIAGAEARRRWHKEWDRLNRKRVTAWLSA